VRNFSRFLSFPVVVSLSFDPKMLISMVHSCPRFPPAIFSQCCSSSSYSPLLVCFGDLLIASEARFPACYLTILFHWLFNSTPNAIFYPPLLSVPDSVWLRFLSGKFNFPLAMKIARNRLGPRGLGGRLNVPTPKASPAYP